VSGRLEEVERLKAEVQALDQVFQTDTDYEHASYKVRDRKPNARSSIDTCVLVHTPTAPAPSV
jgi:hypothetical protein